MNDLTRQIIWKEYELIYLKTQRWHKRLHGEINPEIQATYERTKAAYFKPKTTPDASSEVVFDKDLFEFAQELFYNNKVYSPCQPKG